MNKKIVYQQLEENFVKYRELLNITVKENNDGFVSLRQAEPKTYEVIGRYETLSDMKENFPLVPVRREVKDKLDQADRALKEMSPNLQLVVAYGYRSLEVQQNYFDTQKQKYLKNQPENNDEEIDEIIHRLIAVPNVAGHPTGGAVDVFIEDTSDGTKLDFGVPIFTFDSKDAYSFSPYIRNEAQQNRSLLRKVMTEQGFAPYDGEWWHFSFGDKEWAFYYKKPYAIYEQKREEVVFKSAEKQIRVNKEYTQIGVPLQYSVFRPGGNDTALVIGVERDSDKRKKINDQVMKQHANVEQVGFVKLDRDNPELMMAGGEFCGNATRSTAWQILAGKPGEVLMKVSGVESKLRAGVDEEGNAWAQMPIYTDPSRITFLEDGRAVVAMEGITHVVMNDIYPEASPEELKPIALKLLQQLGLDKSVAASGVMFLTPTESGVSIRPVVLVRDIKTLFYETACGSGTTAVGLLEALKKSGSIELPVTQPTGIPIYIKVSFDGSKFEQAVISGPIEVLNNNEEITV